MIIATLILLKLKELLTELLSLFVILPCHDPFYDTKIRLCLLIYHV